MSSSLRLCARPTLGLVEQVEDHRLSSPTGGRSRYVNESTLTTPLIAPQALYQFHVLCVCFVAGRFSQKSKESKANSGFCLRLKRPEEWFV